MVVTHLRSGDASERELEALAIFMGHSMQMQRESYDRRTKAQKVEPAVGLLHKVSGTPISDLLAGSRAALTYLLPRLQRSTQLLPLRPQRAR